MSLISAPCSTCGSKSAGVFKCQGCSHVFCRKHTGEHRDQLSQQLETIINEHNQLQQTIHDDSHASHPLLMDIQRWEENSIRKIRRLAHELRQEIDRSMQLQRESVATALKNLSQRLSKAREDDDYVETNLQHWMNKLTALREDLMANRNSTLILREDAREPLVPNLFLVSHPSKFATTERLARSIGDISIEDQGQVAFHGARKRGDAFIYGQNEYSRGQHRIRFIINKRTAECLTTFGIVSLRSPGSVYGWTSNDQTVGTGHSTPRSSNVGFRDLKGETTLQIEFFIDCDQRRLAYYNERTTIKREIEVDLNACPFPWQLYFYIFDTNDRIRLLPANRSN